MECLGRSQGQNPRGRRPQGFWPWDLPRHSIHHDTPKAFPYNAILSASRTSKERFLSFAPNTPSPYEVSWSIFLLHCTKIGRVKFLYNGLECRKNVYYTIHFDAYFNVHCTVHYTVHIHSRGWQNWILL